MHSNALNLVRRVRLCIRILRIWLEWFEFAFEWLEFVFKCLEFGIYEWFKFAFECFVEWLEFGSNVSTLFRTVRICNPMIRLPLQWLEFAFECFESLSNG